jgi:hypothetical protein
VPLHRLSKYRQSGDAGGQTVDEALNVEGLNV